MKRTRVCTDFPEQEYAVLNALCQADFRLPDDELRYLVMEAARQRGIFQLSENANRDAVGVGAERVAVA